MTFVFVDRAVVLRRRLDDELQRVERLPRVARRGRGHEVERIVGDFDAVAFARDGSLDGAAEDRHHLLALERRDDDDFRARQQRRVHFERRVLGRRADEDDVARLDVRQKRVLLRFVEAMDLVDEDDRLRSARLRAPCAPPPSAS